MSKDIDRMIGTSGTSPSVQNIERILEVCQELLYRIQELERRAKNIETDLLLKEGDYPLTTSNARKI